MSEPRYTGPPPTGVYRAPPQYPPQYQAPQYPGAPWPQGWAQQPPFPAGSPEVRPASATAAATLGWVTAGLLLLAAGLLFFGAAFLHGIEADTPASTDGYIAEFTFDAIVDVVAAGLLIAGGVGLTSRGATGRLLLSGGAVIVVVEAVYWLTRWTSRTGGAVIVYALLFGALAATSIACAWSRPVSRWLAPR